MVVPDGEWDAVGRDAHAVIDETKAAGVYVLGGGIDENVPMCVFRPTAELSMEDIHGHHRSTAVSPSWNCPLARKPSHGLRASRKPVGQK